VPSYGFALADNVGTILGDVRAPLTLSYARNRDPRVEVVLDVEEDAASLLVDALQDGFPRLKAWRRAEGETTGELILNAPWAPTKRSAADDDQGVVGRMHAQFRGPFATLERRFTAASRVFTATDAGEIAWTMIEETNSADGSTGIIEGTIEATVSRDRTYEHKQLAEAVVQLTGVINGFDFEVAPLDSGATIGEFNVYESQGTDRSVAALGETAVVFEYGPGTIGNVRSYKDETTYPVNKVRVIGANGLTGTASHAPSIDKYETCMTLEQAIDVSEQATLDAKASALLRPEPVVVVGFQPDPELVPQPWDDYWIGDTVQFRARHGCIDLDLAVRINGITLMCDEEGNVASTQLTIEQGV